MPYSLTYFSAASSCGAGHCTDLSASHRHPSTSSHPIRVTLDCEQIGAPLVCRKYRIMIASRQTTGRILIDLSLLCAFLVPMISAVGQAVPKPPDISAVVAAGKVSGERYTNSFFRITLDAPHGQITLAPVVNTAASRARLIHVLASTGDFDQRYSLALLADLLQPSPLLRSPSDYVRGVRLQLEKQGFVTIRDEFPIEISKVAFTGAVMEGHTPDGHKLYRGLYTTFRSGYILSLDVWANSEAHLNDLVASLVHFDQADH